MIHHLARPTARALVLATCWGGIASVGLPSAVSYAQGAASGPSGPATPMPNVSTPSAPAPATPKPGDGAQQPAGDPFAERVAYLHGRLRITSAQEPLWGALVQVMRENDTAVAPLFKALFQATQRGNASDILNADEKLDEAQLAALKTFTAAFQALYASLSDQQKKIADYLFRSSRASEEPLPQLPPVPNTYYPAYPAYPGYPAYSEEEEAMPAYPDYGSGYYFPDYGAFFVGPFSGGRRPFFFHGHPGLAPFHAHSGMAGAHSGVAGAHVGGAAMPAPFFHH
jgi:periplasmic protein CpxP/Spy